MRASLLPVSVCLCSLLTRLIVCLQATLIVGALERDLAHERQYLLGSVPHQLLGMATLASPLSRLMLLCKRSTEQLLHPPPPNTENGCHHLLLQAFEISFFEGLQALQQFQHSCFCLLPQRYFHSFTRLHVQGSPLCCSPCLVLQMRILLFLCFAYNFFIHPGDG